MNQPVPPPLANLECQKSTIKNITAALLLALLICLLLFILASVVISIITGVSIFNWVKEAVEINVKSYTDQFSLTVLNVKSEPDYFTEKVRIQCDRDMTASLCVVDMMKVGMFETHAPNGQIFYVDGDPIVAGVTGVAHANGKFSTCEILFKVSTSSTNTSWHDEWREAHVSSSGDTAILSTPVHVTNIQTNWPGTYNQGSEIPLADIGNYKVLLSVK